MLWNNEAVVGRGGGGGCGVGLPCSAAPAARLDVWLLFLMLTVMNQVVYIFDLVSVPRGHASVSPSVSLLALITFLPPQPGLPAAEAALFLCIFSFFPLSPSDVYQAF